MAMRGIRSGDVRPRMAVRPLYEDFKPMFEWKQDESSDLLIIHLPGFIKEYLKVTIESRNTVRVRGERLVAGNKWSRFQEDYQIPEHSNATGIHAKFDQGILKVTMPRKNKGIPQVPVVLPKTEPKPETIVKPNSENVSNARMEKGEVSDTKESKEIPKVNHNNVSNEEKSPPVNKQEAAISEPKVDDKIITDNKERSPPIKSEELISEAKVDHKNVSNEENYGQDGIKNEQITHEPKGFPEKSSPGVVGKRSSLENEDSESTRNINGEILQKKSKETNENLGDTKLDYVYNKVVMGKDEERQLLVNTGVAVLVIAALAAYAYYTQG